jgi:carbamoylphosphate synthase large subunit
MNTKQIIQAIAANMKAGATLTDAMEQALGCEQYDKMVAVLLRAIQQGRDKVTFNEIMENVCE